jgi:hypothetical protein
MVTMVGAREYSRVEWRIISPNQHGRRLSEMPARARDGAAALLRGVRVA